MRRQFRSGSQLGLSCLVSGDFRLAPHFKISVYLFLIVAGINQLAGRREGRVETEKLEKDVRFYENTLMFGRKKSAISFNDILYRS